MKVGEGTAQEPKNREGSGRELARRQKLTRTGKEWETSGEEAWKKLERNQQELGRARKEPGRDGEGLEK